MDMHGFKDILFVVTSDDNYSDAALERAFTLAVNNQARLTVVEIIDKFPDNIKLPGSGLSSPELQKKIAASYKDKLEEMVAPIRKTLEVQVKVLVGTSFMETIREVLSGHHDLVIKAAQNNDEGAFRVFGGDDMHLLRKCPCAVLLIRPNAGKTFHRIVAAVDVDNYHLPKELQARHLLNVEILDLATSMALSESAELYVVHAWRAVGESIMQGGFIKSSDEEVAKYVEEVRLQHNKKMDGLMEEIDAKLGVEATEYIKPIKQLLKGWPRKEIPLFVNNVKADLVVMGTVGRTGVPGFIMGNTAETILSHINCSVLAIKPEGFKTPITVED
jgi:nucleotide-binding universal stress UspA family protein